MMAGIGFVDKRPALFEEPLVARGEMSYFLLTDVTPLSPSTSRT